MRAGGAGDHGPGCMTYTTRKSARLPPSRSGRTLRPPFSVSRCVISLPSLPPLQQRLFSPLCSHRCRCCLPFNALQRFAEENTLGPLIDPLQRLGSLSPSAPAPPSLYFHTSLSMDHTRGAYFQQRPAPTEDPARTGHGISRPWANRAHTSPALISSGHVP